MRMYRGGFQQRSRLLLTIGMLLTPAVASANSGMSLALGTFGWSMWLPYVAVTVLFEAILLGRWLNLPFSLSIRLSIGANLLTAIIGVPFTGIASYGCLGMLGSELNPNPFLHTLVLFTLFGIASACIEALIWDGPANPRIPDKTAQGHPKGNQSTTVLPRVVMVHLLGVPVGMAILLIPARPYPGLEGQVAAQRHRVDLSIRIALRDYLKRYHKVPPVQSYGELVAFFKSEYNDIAHDPGLWAAAYRVHYERFDMGEQRRMPIEWNRSIVGRTFAEDFEGQVWVTCSQEFGHITGLAIADGGQLFHTSDPAILGYTSKPASELTHQ